MARLRAARLDPGTQNHLRHATKSGSLHLGGVLAYVRTFLA
ncbi:Uncharacterised protein [Mycobacteroides abscessus]|nr:Uncharacterised protein [Mycobacteroides abscessus]CPS19199.1 Uncharacterised protein [Mycobacteroides abscessus]CPS24128.1 Uncharacterised protein [Mycobacteroides abscessus]CPT47049.1 Uncharacterised protein [Mycobacteroides abscessus]CPT48592.1 Uncharacterised protein [Mycobacteroides abscessus]